MYTKLRIKFWNYYVLGMIECIKSKLYTQPQPKIFFLILILNDYNTVKH